MTEQGKANYEGYRAAVMAPMPKWDELSYQAKLGWDAGACSVELWLAEAPVDEDAPGRPEVMHLMTIEMGAWCGASGPGNGRASSQWREVTCPQCTAKRLAQLRTLVRDMLDTMPPSHAAVSFAVRAGRLGVTGPDGRPLEPACAPDSARDALDAQSLHDSPGSDL